jgi:tetratricopeptide (TPR) repeat protein
MKNLQTGIEFKETGNSYFKQGEYKSALENYHKALLYLTGLDNSKWSSLPGNNNVQIEQETKNAIEKNLLSVYLNMAAVYIKIDNFHKCIASCDKALKFDENNSKALFRKAQANEGLNNNDIALEFYLKAAKSAPQDIKIRESLNYIREKIKESDMKYNQQLKLNMAKMMK